MDAEKTEFAHKNCQSAKDSTFTSLLPSIQADFNIVNIL